MPVTNYHDLYEAIRIRHSVRMYDGRPLSKAHLETLQQVCNEPPGLIPGARILLLVESGDRVFPKLMIQGVPAYLVMIGDTAQPHILEAIGYLGEYIVLTATSLGVGTCWMAGTFYLKEIMKKVKLLSPTEKVFAVSPLGYPGKPGIVQTLVKKTTGSGSRRPLSEMLAGDSLSLSDIPYWAKTALEAARLAPSAMNRQPWQFTVTHDSIKVSIYQTGKGMKDDPRRLDCGIAMLHLELGATAVGETGEWQLLDPPDAASYIIKKYNQNFSVPKNRQSTI